MGQEDLTNIQAALNGVNVFWASSSHVAVTQSTYTSLHKYKVLQVSHGTPCVTPETQFLPSIQQDGKHFVTS